MKLTIGKKIGLGFTSLLAILMATGTYSIVVMRSASTDSHHLSTEYVPELELADKLKSTMATLTVNARSYGFTGQRAFADAAQKGFVELTKQLELADDLAARSTQLPQLKTKVASGRERFEEYQRAFAQTE